MTLPPPQLKVPYVVPAITIVSPIQLDDVPCPVNDSNRDEWTEAERNVVVDGCVWARDLDHLVELVCFTVIKYHTTYLTLSQINKYHKDGVRQPGAPYIGIPSSITGGLVTTVDLKFVPFIDQSTDEV